MARTRMPALRMPQAANDARLQEVNAFLKHVDLMVWDLGERDIVSIGGYIIYVSLTHTATGIRRTFNRFDAAGIAELELLTKGKPAMIQSEE